MVDEEQFYQAGAIPYRRRGESIEFCLVTSTKTNEWSFPKGTVKVGETPADTALKNARKEVGVDGRIIEPPVGRYTYRKWETTLEVTLLLMEVEQCKEQWQEADIRRRVWATKDVAMERLSRRELKDLLETACQRLEAN